MRFADAFGFRLRGSSRMIGHPGSFLATRSASDVDHHGQRIQNIPASLVVDDGPIAEEASPVMRRQGREAPFEFHRERYQPLLEARRQATVAPQFLRKAWRQIAAAWPAREAAREGRQGNNRESPGDARVIAPPFLLRGQSGAEHGGSNHENGKPVSHSRENRQLKGRNKQTVSQ